MKIMSRLRYVIVLVPSICFATSIENILNNGVYLLQGPLARACGLLAIVGSGYLCIARQQLPKEQFLMILLGLGIIFGSSSLYSTLIGY